LINAAGTALCSGAIVGVGIEAAMQSPLRASSLAHVHPPAIAQTDLRKS
jgi:hypothetical protein